jgi:hypothetical protein
VLPTVSAAQETKFDEVGLDPGRTLFLGVMRGSAVRRRVQDVRHGRCGQKRPGFLIASLPFQHRRSARMIAGGLRPCAGGTSRDDTGQVPVLAG